MKTLRRSGLATSLVGAATALAGLRVFAPRAAIAARQDAAGMRAGRGDPARPPGAASLQAGYEVPDVAAGQVGWVMLVFAASAFTGVALMVVFLSVLHRQDAARQAALTREQLHQAPPPLPHLQSDPIGELAVLRAREAARLGGYARLDAATARIPIARAMALVRGQSLDAHAAPEPPR